jgi:hypothetical protein
MRLAPILPAALLTLTAAAHAAPVKNACEILPQAEASALFGAPVKPMVPKSIMCMYMTSDMSSGLINGVLSFDDAKTASAKYDFMLRQRPANGPFDAVPGLGDKAYFINSQDGSLVLTVLYKADIVTIQMPQKDGPVSPARRNAMIQAMKKMLPRV